MEPTAEFSGGVARVLTFLFAGGFSALSLKTIFNFWTDGMLSTWESSLSGLVIVIFFLTATITAPSVTSYFLVFALLILSILMPRLQKRKEKAKLDEMLQEDMNKYRRMLEFDPRNAAAHSFLGDAYMKLGKLHLAIKEYEAALELEPESVSDKHKLERAIKLKTKRETQNSFFFCPICGAENSKGSQVCSECRESLKVFDFPSEWFKTKEFRRTLFIGLGAAVFFTLVSFFVRPEMLPILFLLAFAGLVIYFYFRL